MKKFPSIDSIQNAETNIFVDDTHMITVTEKIDGANFRWKLHNSREILVGSRNVVFKSGSEPLSKEDINKQFQPTVEYLYTQIDFNALEQVIDEYGDLVFFGESLRTHSVEYDSWDGKHPSVESDMPNYLGFDIWSVEDKEWLPFEIVAEIHSKVGLETVPVISQTTVAEFDEDDLTIPQSEYRQPHPDAEDQFNKDGLAEGIVLKNEAIGERVKYVSDYMAEVHQIGKPSSDESLEELKHRKKNARKFVTKLVTDARIRKEAHKLVDEGPYDKLEMPMMQHLPENVLRDVFAEEGWEIITNEYGIELTEETKESIRQLASDKCSRVLRDEIESE